jgi:small-conductance mechanosensitive channel
MRLAPLVFGLLAAVFAWTEEAPQGYPVTLDGNTLWTVRYGYGSETAEVRAQRVSEEIRRAAADNRISVDSLEGFETTQASAVRAGRRLIFAVTDEDAKAEGRTRAELMKERLAIVKTAITRYREARVPSAYIHGFLYLIVLVALWAGALWLLLRVYGRMRRWFDAHYARFFLERNMTGVYALFGRPLMLTASGLLRLGAFSAGALLSIAALSYSLSLFPGTAPYSEAVFTNAGDILSGLANSLLNYLPKLAVLVVIVALTHYLIKVSHMLARGIQAGLVSIPGFHPDWAKPTASIVTVLLAMFGLVVAFPYLPGGDSPAFKGVSIFFGVLLSLGSGSAMGNAISGIILTYMRPYREGDRVRISDTVGDIIEKSILVTRVRTIKNVEIIIPNSMILSAHILNYSAQAKDSGLILHTTVTIGYDAPWRRVHELLIAAALKTPGILAHPKPFVFQTALNDFNVSYEINAYTDRPNDMQQIYSDLHQNIQDEFNQGGVEIMSPNYHALRDGNTVTIPEENRPKGYEAPGFRVESK